MRMFKKKNMDIYVEVDGAIGEGGKHVTYKIKKGNDIDKQISEFRVDKTRNWCTLNATTQALQSINELYPNCELKIYSSNLYLINSFNQNWIDRWQINGWLTAKNTPVKNANEWKYLLFLMENHKTTFIYSKKVKNSK